MLEEPEDIKKRDSITVQTIETAAPAQDSSEGHCDGDAGSEGGDLNSKYMNVGTVRFWCVFVTILLGMCADQLSSTPSLRM